MTVATDRFNDRGEVDGSTSTAPLLRVDDLRTYFNTKRGVVRAVDGVTFSLERGQTLGIVGESGSGKSVLSRSIINVLPKRGVLKPSGAVFLEGRSIRDLPRRDLRPLRGPEMAMVFQDPMTSLNPVMKIGIQIAESLATHTQLTKHEIFDRSVDLLRSVGIPDARSRLNEYPHQLSGGMRQRVTIAIAISCNPKLLLADEPTTALDVTVQKQILDLLETQQAERNMGMILVTHDLGIVAGRSDFTMVLYAGQPVEYAPTAMLFSEMKHPYTEALLKSIPRITNPPHSKLMAIFGRPPDLVNPPAGCRFAARCRYAQERCLEEDPEETTLQLESHKFRCFYPVGTVASEEALVVNVRRGRTAAGLVVGIDT